MISREDIEKIIEPIISGGASQQDIDSVVDSLYAKYEDKKRLERRVRELENQMAHDSWRTNPDRAGGCYTQEEIDNATAWR